MQAKPLKNYLRTHRKKSGLTQEEIAFLLGCQKGSKVSRYECSSRLPSPQTMLMFEFLFGVPVRELFPKLSQDISQELMWRIKALINKIAKLPKDQVSARKVACLQAISKRLSLHS